MCGIGGILRVTPPGEAAAALARDPREAIPEHWLDIIDESIKHRGHDGAGRFRDRATRPDGSVVDVALVHRRLSIIDHEGGAQPMVSIRAPRASGGLPAPGTHRPLLFHGRPNDPVAYQPLAHTGGPELALGGPSDLVAVIFNGCIYNHRELRKELEAAGHEFVTDHSDTEVLVHGWKQWGADIAERLDGMYACAIWDRGMGGLLLMRDSMGEKPLYIALCAGPPFILPFASTVTGLARLELPLDAWWVGPKAERQLNWGMRQWVGFGFDRCPPIRGAGAIEPGEVCIASHAPVTAVRKAKKNLGKDGWWSYRSNNECRLRDQRPHVDHVDDVLSTCVGSRLEADVPIGCFLSGGIDSSLICLYAHAHRPDIEAFTVRMPSAVHDESSHARVVASHIGIQHHILECEADPATDLVMLIQQLGLPFGDSSLLPTHWVSRAAARHVRVALSGDGGDELFAGYRRYQAAHLFGLLGPFRYLLWPAVPFFHEAADPRSVTTTRSRFINAAVRSCYADLLAIFPEPMPRQLGFKGLPFPLWGKALFETVKFGLDVIAPVLEVSCLGRVDGAIGSDLRLYLPEDILRKTDTASMAIPIEVRAPFLARDVRELATRMTVRHLMPHGQRKGLLRQVARKYFPPEIVDRPKMGFAIPIGEWFRSNYGGMRDLLYDHIESAEPFGPPSLGINLNMDFIRRMLKEHDDAGGSSVWPWKGRDHSQRLYMLLVLSIWAKWLGGLRKAD